MPDSQQRNFNFPVLIPILVCLAAGAIWMLGEELARKRGWGVEESLLVLGFLAAPTVLRGIYLAMLYTRCRMTDQGAPGTVAEARARLFFWLALRFQGLGEAHQCGIVVYRNRVEGVGKAQFDEETKRAGAVAMIRRG